MMQYVLAAVVIALFALFIFIGGFLLKDSRKSETKARVEVKQLQKELETCLRSNP